MKKSSTVRVSPGLFPPGPNSATSTHTSSLYLPDTKDHPPVKMNLFVEEPPVKLFPPGACLYVNDAPVTLYPPESLEQAKEHVPVVAEEMPKLFPPGASTQTSDETAELHHPHKMKGAFHQLHTHLCPATRVFKTDMFTPMANRSWFYGSEIATIYGFPKPDTTRSVTVGVISFGGGLYGNVAQNGLLTNGDVQAYWTACGIQSQNHPKVYVVPLFGASNTVSDGGTDENTLDVEMIGSACPSANLTIILYLVPNSLANFKTVVEYAITTQVNGNIPIPKILSVSWGASELYDYGNLEAALKTATDQGINIFVASGDFGSNDNSGNASTCNYPSSSPYVTSCGGTNLVCPSLAYDSNTQETTWTGSGGGISKIYSKPSYQSSLSGNYRQTPDISLVADPATGVLVILNGGYYIYGGTSIVAPLLAGFLATINVSKFINPLLYSAPSNCFRDILTGNNGAYIAKTGYDACTGLGSINGTNLSKWLVDTIHVTSITVSPATVSLPIQRTTQLSVSVLPSNAADKSVTWSSSAPSVCSVSSTGFVTSLAYGNAVITARSNDGGFTSSSQITVPSPSQTISVNSIAISPSTINLSVNQTYQINPTFTPVNATNKSVTWTSSNVAVATVSTSGLVTVRQSGTAVITVRTVDGGKSATLTVTAVVSVSSISITPTAINLPINQTYQVNAVVLPANAANKQITWSSSNSTVASVTSSGVVTARQTGTSVVKATTVDGGKTSFIVVSVYVPVVSVNITSPSTINLTLNQTYQINYAINPTNASNKAVSWASSKSNIAAVSASGLITAKTIGTCVITVKSVDGNKTSSCTVNVSRVTQSGHILTKNIPMNLNHSTKAGQSSHMKVMDPDIARGLVVKSFMKYKID